MFNVDGILNIEIVYKPVLSVNTLIQLNEQTKIQYDEISDI